MRDNEMKLTNVKKSCSIAKKVVKVFRVIMLVVAIMCAVGAVTCIGLSKQIDTGIANSIEQGYGTFDASAISIDGIINLKIPVEKMADKGYYGALMATYCVFGSIMSIIVFVIFLTLERVFQTIEESDTPFCELVLRRLKRVFIMLVVITALFSGLGFGAILGLSLWCIYRIFEYGTTLQIEVDETL